MVDIVYIYSQLLGILNFSYDCRTGKARVKPHITAYCATMCLIMFIVLIYFLVNMEIKSRPPGSAELHYKLNLLTSFVRIVGVIITIFYNWTKRKDFVCLINSYQKFCKNFLEKWQKEEKYMMHLECGIRRKLQISFVADILIYLLTVDIFREIFDMDNPYILIPLALIPTVLNVIMTLYYFAILNVNILMLIINDELKRILDLTATICQSQENINYFEQIVLRNHCCQLSDELDELSSVQYELRNYLKFINRMYDIQGVCVMLNLYINNICVIYMFCMFFEHFELWSSYGKWVAYFVPIAFLIFYLDMKLFLFAMLNTVDLVEETGKLLRERQVWMMQMNEKLESSVSKFANYNIMLII